MAADATIKGIEFQVIGKAKGAQDSLDALSNTLKRLKRVLGGGLGMNSLVKNLEKMGAASNSMNAENIQKFAKALSLFGKVKIDPSLQKSIEQVARSFDAFDQDKVRASADAMAQLAKLKGFGADKFQEGMTALVAGLEQISQMDLSNLERAGEAMRNFADAFRAASSAGGKDGGVVPNAPEEQAQEYKNLFEMIAEAGKSAASKIKDAFSRIWSVAKGAGSVLAIPFKKSISSVKDYVGKLGGVLGGFKRIAGYRLIRTIIKEITEGFSEGTKNLYAWSQAMGGAVSAKGETFAQAMDRIATAMLYLKNSVGAAVGPLISALAPAIDFVTDKIVMFLNVVNQLIARLTGASSWNRAVKQATSYGDAVSGAGAAAKEALRYLAPFDELNVLPDDKDRGSGGGGSADDASGMFEEVTEFNQAIADFADSIKEKVNASDWKGLGELLGNKVNDVVNMIDFAGAGAKVGTGINAWFTTKYWTLETINFQNIGSKIAEFLNNAISNIDFNVLGRLITQKWTIVGDFLIGAIETINWGQVTSKLSDFIIGAFDQLSEWLHSVDWSEFGSTLWSSLKDAVEGIDFGGIASSLMYLLGSAIRAAANLVYNFARDAVHDIWGYFLGFAQDDNGDGEVAGLEIIKGVLKGIVNGIKNIGAWIKENIFDPFINGFKDAFGIHSPAETMEEPGQMVSEGILAGILKPFKTIKAWVKEHIVDPLATAIKEKIAEATDLVNIGLDIIDNMLSGIQDGWVLMKAWFSDNFVRGIAQFGIDAANGLLQPVENMINSVIDDINGMTEDLPQWMKDKLGLEELEHIDLKIIPDLDPPVGTFYNETKQRIEEESKAKPTSLTSTADMTAVKDSIPVEEKEISTTARYDASKRNLSDNARTVSTWARYDSSKNNLNEKKRTISTWARYNAIKNNLNEKKRTISTWANFTARKDGLSANEKTFGSTANFTSYNDGFYDAPSIDATANITDVNINYTPEIDVKGNIYDTVQKASGGVYSGGAWHDIAQYASGGSPRTAQMFIAREAGPELVGTLGGHTAVMNNDQIVASVSAGVARAIAGIKFHMTGFASATPVQAEEGMSEETLYRAMVRALNDSDVFPDTIDLDGDVVYRKMVQRNRRERTRLGVNPMMAT